MSRLQRPQHLHGQPGGEAGAQGVPVDVQRATVVHHQPEGEGHAGRLGRHGDGQQVEAGTGGGEAAGVGVVATALVQQHVLGDDGLWVGGLGRDGGGLGAEADALAGGCCRCRCCPQKARGNVITLVKALIQEQLGPYD